MHSVDPEIPSLVFQVSAPTDFRDMAWSAGNKLAYINVFKVTAAGTVEVRMKAPRDGHATESLVLEAGETVQGRIVELVDADVACYPIMVWR